MRVFHTSDWHLGQSLHGYQRVAEHRHFLEWLRAQIRDRKPDALLISGDVYDTVTPSATANRHFAEFIANVHLDLPSLQIRIIAGNHDSGYRLEAYEPFHKAFNTRIVGIVPRLPGGGVDLEAMVSPLTGADGQEALCVMLPYVRPGDGLALGKGEDGEAPLLAALREHLKDDPRPKICMAHLYAAGAGLSAEDNNERQIGGLEGVSQKAVGDGWAYLAFGHLHRAQKVYGLNTARYSGAPLCMTFAERENRHGIVEVNITATGTQVEEIRYEPPVHLVRLQGGGESILQQITELFPEGKPGELSPIIDILLQDEQPDPTFRKQLEEAVDGRNVRIGPLRLQPPKPQDGQDPSNIDSTTENALSPLELARKVWLKRKGVEMPQEQVLLFIEIERLVREGEAE